MKTIHGVLKIAVLSSGCKTHLTFPMKKLKDYSGNIEGSLKETNPFAIITAAHLQTKATKKDVQTRFSWRWTITTALYESGFSKQDILNIYRLIDWLMTLPEDLTKRFTQDLIKYEEEKKMPYIMNAERISTDLVKTTTSYRDLFRQISVLGQNRTATCRF